MKIILNKVYTMYLDNNIFDDENNKRLIIAVAGAMLIHILILLWFYSPYSENIISAETYSPPTNISIRFTQPIKEPVKTAQPQKIEPVKKKRAVQKPLPQELNKVEPAATQPQILEPTPQELTEITKPIRETIPVISDASIKGRRVQPEYPKRSLRMRQEGVVWLHVLINEDGKRQEIKLHKPSQYALLNQAALKAVKKWTFDPNIVNGRAIRSWVEIPIEFKIQ